MSNEMRTAGSKRALKSILSAQGRSHRSDKWSSSKYSGIIYESKVSEMNGCQRVLDWLYIILSFLFTSSVMQLFYRWQLTANYLLNRGGQPSGDCPGNGKMILCL